MAASCVLVRVHAIENVSTDFLEISFKRAIQTAIYVAIYEIHEDLSYIKDLIWKPLYME